MAVVSYVSAFLLSFCTVMTSFAHAQMTRVPAQVDEGAIPLYDALEVSGNEVWTDIGTERWVRNVSTPTIIPVLPPPDRATGEAVLVIPGGGFQFVSIDNEGYRVAEWLKEKGIASFILKYRPLATPDAEEAFSEHMNQVWSGRKTIDYAAGAAIAVADATAALDIIHQHSEKWGIDVENLGVLGFSAGAVTARELTLSLPAEKLAFVGYIYGPMEPVELKPNLPPLFAALAIDDPLFDTTETGLVKGWRQTGAPVEYHLYGSGGHGFGSYKKGTTSDLWFSQFTAWLETLPDTRD